MKYDSTKPWTFKSKEEEKRTPWETKKPSYQHLPHYKRGKPHDWPSYDRPSYDRSTQQNKCDGRNVISAGATPNIKEEPASKLASIASPCPNTQPSNYSHGAPSNQPSTQSKESFGQRKCYYCGKYGHLARDCYKRKHINIASVPTLAEIPCR